MGLNRYACCRETIGEPHGETCGGSARYPLGRERTAADGHARRIARELDDRERLRPERRP